MRGLANRRALTRAEPGKRADLVGRGVDPLADIANTRQIRYVRLGGRLLRPDDLLGEAR